MKKCLKCQVEKPFSQFHRQASRPDGYQGYCIACRKLVDAAAYQAKKQGRKDRSKAYRGSGKDFLRSLKEGKPCTDCGNSFHFSAMEWDHLPGTIKIGCVSMMGTSPKKALEEIKKCELVCANCHAVRTWKRKEAAKV